MKVSGKELIGYVEGIVYEKTQVKEYGIDLTIKCVYEIKDAGSLDFGGSEYRMAGKNKIDPVKKIGDKYGWWHLEHKTYLVSLNETVKPGFIYYISPHTRLLNTGANHPTVMTTEWGSEEVLPLQVSEQGLNLKENARISRLFALRIQ